MLYFSIAIYRYVCIYYITMYIINYYINNQQVRTLSRKAGGLNSRDKQTAGY